jgi:hypothetical protein
VLLLSNSQLRVIHGAELEARVATLEMQLAQEQQKNAAELAEVADQAEPAVVDDADTGSSSVTGDGAAWRRSRRSWLPQSHRCEYWYR